MQPQAVVESNGVVHLVFLKGDPAACDVFYSRRSGPGAAFSNPIRVNSVSNSAVAMGTVRGAQLALGRNGRVHVVWNGSEKAAANPGAGAPMLYARTAENGVDFEPQRNLMHSTTHLDGGGSVAADPDGHVYVAWHGHRKTGPQEEIDRAVFLATSDDDGSHFTVERQVNPPQTGACGCCGLKISAATHGAVAILYRSATLDGNRDSELLLSTNYGKSFSAQVTEPWHISTCPMSTHALQPIGDGFRGAWERQGRIGYAEIRLGAVMPLKVFQAGEGAQGCKHPTFAASAAGEEKVLLAWTEGTGWERGGTLAWGCFDGQGRQTASGREQGVPVWSYAAAVPEPGGDFTLIY